MGNYDFEKDLSVAKKTEKEIGKLIRERLGDDVEIEFGKTKDFDIRFTHEGKVYTVEIKEDFMCKKTGNVCVEYESRGRPSGINTTKAMMYFYKIHEPNGSINVYGARTDTLKQMIADHKYSRTVSGGDAGSNTKSYLFKLDLFKSHVILL